MNVRRRDATLGWKRCNGNGEAMGRMYGRVVTLASAEGSRKRISNNDLVAKRKRCNALAFASCKYLFLRVFEHRAGKMELDNRKRCNGSAGNAGLPTDVYLAFRFAEPFAFAK
jgi:hypothetical protein